MKQEDIMCELFNFSIPTYYKRKREKNKAIILIEKYFQKEEILEFINTGKVRKFDNITYDFLLKNQLFYINSFAESQSLLSEPHVNDKFKDFYFNFLANFGKIDFPFNIDILGIQSLITHYLYQYQTQEIKKNLEINNINQELENKKLEIDNAIASSSGKLKKDLEKLKENFDSKFETKRISDEVFSKNKRGFEVLMLHFFTFNSWNNDMYYFLELVKKDEFDYFINSKNNELLYQAIGYLVYSHYKNLDMHDKLVLIYSTYHYFLGNKSLISKENIKKHILDRVNNPNVFKEIDEKLMNDYIKSPFPDNHTNNFDINFENEEIETLSFEDLVKKDMERKLKN